MLVLPYKPVPTVQAYKVTQADNVCIPRSACATFILLGRSSLIARDCNFQYIGFTLYECSVVYEGSWARYNPATLSPVCPLDYFLAASLALRAVLPVL